MNTLLLRMTTGSYLYALNHAGSDHDYLEVWDHCKSYHKVTPEGDITKWSLSQFMALANKGAHNALEAMFAPVGWPQVDLIADLRSSYVANPYLVAMRFSKAAETYTNQGTLKGAVRARMLLVWTEEVFNSGRFDPRWGLTHTLSDDSVNTKV